MPALTGFKTSPNSDAEKSMLLDFSLNLSALAPSKFTYANLAVNSFLGLQNAEPGNKATPVSINNCSQN